MLCVKFLAKNYNFAMYILICKFVLLYYFKQQHIYPYKTYRKKNCDLSFANTIKCYARGKLYGLYVIRILKCEINTKFWKSFCRDDYFYKY